MSWRCPESPGLSREAHGVAHGAFWRIASSTQIDAKCAQSARRREAPCAPPCSDRSQLARQTNRDQTTERPDTTLANTQTSIHAPARLHTDAQPHTDAPLPAPSGRTGRARRRYVSALASRAARARARVPIRTRRPARPAGPEPKRAQLEAAVEVLSSLAARGCHPTRSARPGGSA